MRKLWFLIPCLLSAQVIRTADPIKRGFQLNDFPRTVKVAEGVYTYEDFHSGAEKFTTTDMFVVTDDGVLVADAQGSVEATRGLVEAIRKITSKPIKYVVVCSDHGDHTGGNSVLPPGIVYFIHPTSRAILERQTNGWKPPADVRLVTEKQTIHMGQEDFEILFLGRAHTGGDLSVYLPRRKILFLSETFLNRVFPAMRSAYPSDWLRSLDRAEKMNADIYIPGHGFTETAAVSKEELRNYHQALQSVIDEATRLYKAGVPVEDAIKQADWGEYKSWTLATSQGPIAIRKVYEELSGKLR
jgi:cyclase